MLYGSSHSPVALTALIMMFQLNSDRAVGHYAGVQGQSAERTLVLCSSPVHDQSGFILKETLIS